jgi:hypothetical protein
MGTVAPRKRRKLCARSAVVILGTISPKYFGNDVDSVDEGGMIKGQEEYKD